MNQESPLDSFPCAVCKHTCQKACQRCFKIYYCSIEHQKQDWEGHKPICHPYPIKMKTFNLESPVRNIFATKDISAGQVIFKEKSIISGPWEELDIDDPTVEVKVICLSCYKELDHDHSYVCSQCEWPVCDADCEKVKIHADNECKIFAEKGVKPLPLKEEITLDGRNLYANITILRTLLLRDNNPTEWIKVMNIFSFPVVRANFPYAQAHQKLVVKFIQKTCGMSNIDEKLIERVSGVIGFKSRGNDSSEHENADCNSPKTACFLYHDLSFVSCSNKDTVANCYIKQTNISKSEIEVVAIATRSIQIGNFILQMSTNPPGSGRRNIYSRGIAVAMSDMQKLLGSGSSSA